MSAPETHTPTPIVKPLEWGETSYGTPEVYSVVGVYRINDATDGGYSLIRNSESIPDIDGRRNFSTIETAKTAAKSHYERRILSALSPDAVTAVNSFTTLTARIEMLEEALKQAREALDGEPEYHHQGMGCGLEDRNITDRYDAMHHGWECAMERVYGEHIVGARQIIDAALGQGGERNG